jgi:hypothetical protein
MTSVGLTAVESQSIVVWSLLQLNMANEDTTEYNEEDLAAMTNAKSSEELAAAIRQSATTQAPLTGVAPPEVRQHCQDQCAVIPQFNQQSSTVAAVEGDESSPVAALKGRLPRKAAKRAEAAKAALAARSHPAEAAG